MAHDEVKAHAKIAKDYIRLMKTARKPVHALRMYLQSYKDGNPISLDDQTAAMEHIFQDGFVSKFSPDGAKDKKQNNLIV